MPTLDQERAKMAFVHVGELQTKPKEEQNKYASIVHAMPALLRSAGLSQALHFVLSRKNAPQRAFLGHLSAQLGRVDKQIKDETSLLEKVRTAELADYLRLTQEALACVHWYRRFVQGVLGIAAGEADDREE
jgi:CRISPR-associated protein Cmr5